MYQKTVLPNGLRLITSTMPHTHSISISIFIGVGSRYEDQVEMGISHFIEHLCFKGTQRRATAKEICETIEGVGGVLNGGTDKELTIYWCKVARPHFPLAVDMLEDMLRHSRFDPVDIEKERQVIIEEISMSLDSPQERADMLIDDLLWPDQPLGRDVIGTKETVATITHPMMLDYFSRHYLSNNVVISIAGDITHQEVEDSLSAAFSNWANDSLQPYHPANDAQQSPRLYIEHRDTEQVHLCLAVRGLSTTHPDRFILDLLNVVLGEGMSSRLFTEIREKRGLAYAIHSHTSHFHDTGSVTIYAGVDPQQIETAIVAILHELSRIKDRVPEPELSKAKELSKGRLLLRMEDTRTVAIWTGGQELLTGRILTVDEVASLIDAITAEELQRVAQGLLATGNLNLTAVGPIHNEEHLEELLKF